MRRVEFQIGAGRRAYKADGSRDEQKWIEDWYVRASSIKRAVELLNEHVGDRFTLGYVRNYKLLWGNHTIDPAFAESKEGIWFTKNHYDNYLHPWWVDGESHHEESR